MQAPQKVSDIVLRILKSYVSDKRKREIEMELGRRIFNNKKNVRIQCYIPTEIYMVLHAFGAFNNSESHFFAMVSSDFVEQRAIRMGIMNTVLESIEEGK